MTSIDGLLLMPTAAPTLPTTNNRASIRAESLRSRLPLALMAFFEPGQRSWRRQITSACAAAMHSGRAKKSRATQNIPKVGIWFGNGVIAIMR